MKSIMIILIIVLCIFVVSCTNNQKQQNTIIGGADGTTEIVIDRKDCKDTVTYRLHDCLLWYIKQLPEEYKDKKACMWTEYEDYQENV